MENLKKIHNDLYGKNVDYKDSLDRYTELLAKHKEYFKKDKDIALFSTPGRSEIAGNHTDHNLGKVIAASINLDTIAAVSKRDDNRVILKSEGFPVVDIDISDTAVREYERNTTEALVRGIAQKITSLGFSLKGFNANTTTNVLKGSGLSSSAAIEILCGNIFSNLYCDDKLSPLDLSLIGKFSENEYFGKPSGLMDQIGCSFGNVIGIDFKNPANPTIVNIDADFNEHGYELVIVDTKGNHADLTPDYAAVPTEMKTVAAYFGKTVLREVDEAEFYAKLSELKMALNNDRAILRAIHFFNENRRVDRMIAALKYNDINTFFKEVNESGNSSFKYLQNIYSPAHPTVQGLSIGLALSERLLNGSGATRVHGGGFAGTIQAYVKTKEFEKYKEEMELVFGKKAVTILSVRKLPTTRIN